MTVTITCSSTILDKASMLAGPGHGLIKRRHKETPSTPGGEQGPELVHKEEDYSDFPVDRHRDSCHQSY